MQASYLTPSCNNTEAQLSSTQLLTQALNHQNVTQNNTDTSEFALPQILFHSGTSFAPNQNKNGINHQAQSMQPSIPISQSYHPIPSTSTSYNHIPSHMQSTTLALAPGFQLHGNFNSLPSAPHIIPVPKGPVLCRLSITSAPNTPNTDIATAARNIITSNKRRRNVAPSIRPIVLSSSVGYAYSNERTGTSGIYSTTASNSMMFAHMQNWKLNQLGELSDTFQPQRFHLIFIICYTFIIVRLG